MRAPHQEKFHCCLLERQADPVHPALLQGRSTTFGFSTSEFSTSGLGQLVLAEDLLEDLLTQELFVNEYANSLEKHFIEMWRESEIRI